MVALLQVGESELYDADQLLTGFERLECEESLSSFLQHAWRWIDPAQALSTAERERERRGISHRTLTRLVNRLEQL